MSMVAQQYNILSQQLREGIAGFERHQTEEAEMGFKKAQLDYQLNDPVAQLKRTEASQEIIDMESQLSPADFKPTTPGQKMMIRDKVIPEGKLAFKWEVDENGFYTLDENGKKQIVKKTKQNKRRAAMLVAMMAEPKKWAEDMLGDVEANLANEGITKQNRLDLEKKKGILIEQLKDIETNPEKYTLNKINTITTMAQLTGDYEAAQLKLPGIMAKLRQELKNKDIKFDEMAAWQKQADGTWKFVTNVPYRTGTAFKPTEDNARLVKTKAGGGEFGGNKTGSLAYSPNQPSADRVTPTSEYMNRDEILDKIRKIERSIVSVQANKDVDPVLLQLFGEQEGGLDEFNKVSVEDYVKEARSQLKDLRRRLDPISNQALALGLTEDIVDDYQDRNPGMARKTIEKNWIKKHSQGSK